MQIGGASHEQGLLNTAWIDVCDPRERVRLGHPHELVTTSDSPQRSLISAGWSPIDTEPLAELVEFARASQGEGARRKLRHEQVGVKA
jgi:hypothetical protein